MKVIPSVTFRKDGGRSRLVTIFRGLWRKSWRQSREIPIHGITFMPRRVGSCGARRSPPSDSPNDTNERVRPFRRLSIPPSRRTDECQLNREISFPTHPPTRIVKFQWNFLPPFHLHLFLPRRRVGQPARSRFAAGSGEISVRGPCRA